MNMTGYKTYTVFGCAFAVAMALLLWDHFEPGLLSEVIAAQMEAVVVCSVAGLGLRAVTTTPAGKAG